MARLELHPLTGTKRAGRLAALVESLYQSRKRIVVWVADEGRRQILDDYLWTFRQLAFVPHAVWTPGMATEMEEPVVLVGHPGNPNRAEALVVGDDLPPFDWAAAFAEIHDLIPPGAEGEERSRRWREALEKR